MNLWELIEQQQKDLHFKITAEGIKYRLVKSHHIFSKRKFKLHSLCT